MKKPRPTAKCARCGEVYAAHALNIHDADPGAVLYCMRGIVGEVFVPKTPSRDAREGE